MQEIRISWSPAIISFVLNSLGLRVCVNLSWVRSAYCENQKSNNNIIALTLFWHVVQLCSPPIIFKIKLQVELKIRLEVGIMAIKDQSRSGADLEGGCRGCAPPPPREMKPSFSYSLLKSVYLTSQLHHSLVVDPLLRKILDPPV